MTVRKAVIPAAGYGTRVLPASKAIPKEMLPIVDKPVIQYIVEEAVASGIEDILIITSRGKTAIEDHFDRMPLLESTLHTPAKQDMLESVIAPAKLANISFIRQQEINGLGAAIYCAKSFVGNEPFAVLYADDVIFSKIPVTKQLITAFEQMNRPVLGIKEVSDHQISRYSSLKVKHAHDNVYFVDDMVEKPTPDRVLSHFAILGRVVLTPEIFDILRHLPPGAGNEIQLTDAMKVLANNGGCIGVDFEGERYDMGNKLGIMKAAINRAIVHPEIGTDFREYLRTLIL